MHAHAAMQYLLECMHNSERQRDGGEGVCVHNKEEIWVMRGYREPYKGAGL